MAGKKGAKWSEEKRLRLKAHFAQKGYTPTMPLAERFWNKVEKGDDASCWIWKGTRPKQMVYGIFWFNPLIGYTPPHRASWMLINGPIPEGLFVCHSCDNPICVNPSHLFLGTPAQNSADMCQKERQARGERSASSKFRSDQIRDIRERAAAGISKAQLAREFGVTDAAIAAIVFRRVWSHVH